MMAALPRERSQLAAGQRSVTSEEGPRELEDEGIGSAPTLRPLPTDLASLRDRLARGRDLLPVPPPSEDLFPTAIP